MVPREYTKAEVLARLSELDAPVEMIAWAKRVLGSNPAKQVLFQALVELGHGVEAHGLVSRWTEDALREDADREAQRADADRRWREAERARLDAKHAKAKGRREASSSTPAAEAARIDFAPVLLAMKPVIAYDFPERSRSLCIRCESAPAAREPPTSGDIRDFGTLTVFCSSRCESEFFGPACDWSAVYREEIDRTGARPTSLPPADGPESWKEDHFVRSATHLSMPQGRKYAPIRQWSSARLSRIEQPGRGLRPAIALGGKAGHLAAVSCKTK